MAIFSKQFGPKYLESTQGKVPAQKRRGRGWRYFHLQCKVDWTISKTNRLFIAQLVKCPTRVGFHKALKLGSKLVALYASKRVRKSSA